MPQGRVSKRSVDALVCPTGKDREFLWDDDLAGFGVAAFPSGKKVYVAQFRKNGRSSRVSIGPHGRLTPDEARIEAKVLLGDVAKGADPLAARKSAKAVPTFREIADEFMEKHVGKKRKPLTFETYDRLLRNHVLPAVGSQRVADRAGRVPKGALFTPAPWWATRYAITQRAGRGIPTSRSKLGTAR